MLDAPVRDRLRTLEIFARKPEDTSWRVEPHRVHGKTVVPSGFGKVRRVRGTLTSSELWSDKHYHEVMKQSFLREAQEIVRREAFDHKKMIRNSQSQQLIRFTQQVVRQSSQYDMDNNTSLRLRRAPSGPEREAATEDYFKEPPSAEHRPRRTAPAGPRQRKFFILQDVFSVSASANHSPKRATYHSAAERAGFRSSVQHIIQDCDDSLRQTTRREQDFNRMHASLRDAKLLRRQHSQAETLRKELSAKRLMSSFYASRKAATSKDAYF